MKSKGSLPHFFFLSLSLSISLLLSLSLSLSLMDLKITPPQSLLQIGGERGPIETVNLAVCEDVAEILGADVSHAHRFDTNWNLVFFLSLHRGGSHGG